MHGPFRNAGWGRAVRLYLQNAAVRPYVDDVFGGLPNFVKAWKEKSGEARGATVVYDWIKNGLPNQAGTVLDFFGMLDIDPLAALDFDRSQILTKFAELRYGFLMAKVFSSDRFRSFEPLFELYYPGPTWPNAERLRQHYRHDWHTVEFAHQPEKNDGGRYAAISIEFSEDVPPSCPLAIHIAYQHGLSRDDLWRPFGSIVHRLGQNHLFHENGHRQEEAWSSFGTMRFETYYGPSPVSFKLASVHPFSVSKIEVPSRLIKPLQFPGR